MNKLINRLQQNVDGNISEDQDERDWDSQIGILISSNDAKELIGLYEFYKGVVNSRGVENNKEICKLSRKIKYTNE